MFFLYPTRPGGGADAKRRSGSPEQVDRSWVHAFGTRKWISTSSNIFLLYRGTSWMQLQYIAKAERSHASVCLGAYPGLYLPTCLFNDERVPLYRPRDDVVRRLLDHPEEQLNEHGRGAGVEHVLILLNSRLSAVTCLFFVVIAHVCKCDLVFAT